MSNNDYSKDTHRNASQKNSDGGVNFNSANYSGSNNSAGLTIDTIIDNRYILKQFKGRGSFGEVWLAYDNELDIEVAIKLYISLDQNGQDEFKSEYKVVFGLIHQNLLTAQHYGVWDHRPYLIMKYCSRGSAYNLAGNITDEKDIWRFIHDVSAGLKYLHGLETPIVHQDIKPENILIDEQGTYLITDFGVSLKLRSTLRKQSKRSAESGAIAYMGPERFLKDPIAVKASDIWSLGVSIYEMVTGELPFCGQGGGMLNAGAEIPDLDTSKWSRNLNEVMRACLAKDTWERPTAEKLEDYSRLMLNGNTPVLSQPTDCDKSNESTDSKKSDKIVAFGFIGGIALLFIIILNFTTTDDSKHQVLNNQQVEIEIAEEQLVEEVVDSAEAIEDTIEYISDNIITINDRSDKGPLKDKVGDEIVKEREKTKVLPKDGDKIESLELTPTGWREELTRVIESVKARELAPIKRQALNYISRSDNEQECTAIAKQIVEREKYLNDLNKYRDAKISQRGAAIANQLYGEILEGNYNPTRWQKMLKAIADNYTDSTIVKRAPKFA